MLQFRLCHQVKPEFISKSGFRENWNLMNSDTISSRFLKSLTSDDLSSQDGTRSVGSWNGEDKIVRTNTSPLLADIVLRRRSLIKSSLIMSAVRDSIVSIVASDDMFPISWIIPGLRASYWPAKCREGALLSRRVTSVALLMTQIEEILMSTHRNKCVVSRNKLNRDRQNPFV